VFGGKDRTAQGSRSIAMRCALPICTIISCCKTFDLSVIAEQSISGNQGSVIRVRSILGLFIYLTTRSKAVHRPGYSTHLASPLVFSLSISLSPPIALPTEPPATTVVVNAAALLERLERFIVASEDSTGQIDARAKALEVIKDVRAELGAQGPVCLFRSSRHLYI
jgi:hypothetical protein